MDNPTEKTEITVQIPAFAHRISKDLAKKAATKSKIALAAAVLAFETLPSDEKGRWISTATVRHMGPIT